MCFPSLPPSFPSALTNSCQDIESDPPLRDSSVRGSADKQRQVGPAEGGGAKTLGPRSNIENGNFIDNNITDLIYTFCP